MILQAVRYLMKTVKAIGRGLDAKYPLDYLNNMRESLKKKSVATNPKDFLNLDILQDCLKQRSLFSVGHTMKQFVLQTRDGKDQQALINENLSQEVIEMTKNHFMYLSFFFAKKHMESANFKDPRIKSHLRNLLVLFSLKELTQNSTPLYESAYFKPGASVMIFEAYKQ
jgi:hypothetical protein